MKTLVLITGIVALFAGCNTVETLAPSSDSAVVSSLDSTTVVSDSVKVDTLKK
jgi:uncharacterized protein YceK